MINQPSETSRSPEFARYTKVDVVPGVEVMHARFSAHRFGPHTHDTWALGAVVHGAQDSAPRDGQHRIAQAGDLTAIPPGEVHAGRPANDGALEYAMLYIDEAALRRQAVDLGLPHVEPHRVALPDPPLTRRILSFVDLALQPGTGRLAVETEWCTLMAHLLPRHAGEALAKPRPAATHAGLNRAIACLHARWSDPVSLHQLAMEAGMSPSYFCRLFTRTYGLPPHRYQTVLRVSRAKALLEGGVAAAEVAAATGFADQSHLGRHLKSCLGLTPAALARPQSRTTNLPALSMPIRPRAR